MKDVRMEDVTELANRATREMREFQTSLRREPEQAHVVLGGLRHALIPTHILARDLLRELDVLLGRSEGAMVLSRIGRLTGRSQAEAFFADREVAADAAFRVLCGPMYFAWAGYGDVDMLLWEIESDDDFAILWESDNSFSAIEAVRDGDRRRSCHLQAGYAAGWCEVAMGMQLETKEIACRAEGVSHCRFLIAPVEGFHERMLNPRFHRPTSAYSTWRIDRTGLVEHTVAVQSDVTLGSS